MANEQLLSRFETLRATPPDLVAAHVEICKPRRFVRLLTLLPLLLSVTLTSCLDPMTKQDREFVARIKEELRHKGDIVRVSDIHPGEWSKVCFAYSGGSLSHSVLRTVSEHEGIDAALLTAMNRKPSDLMHGGMYGWGIYFFYPPSGIEYFSVFSEAMHPNQIKAAADNYSCAVKEHAHFKAMRDQQPGKHTDDFLSIQLTEIKEGQ